MTLAQLRAFLTSFEEQSFTAAALQLGTSQAAVSELVARLEDELDLSLFTRGSRRLVPSAAAYELRTYAKKAIVLLDSGVDALRSIASLEGGVTQFGVLRNAGYYDLADLVQRFHTRYPKVRIRMVGLNSGLVAESIAAGEIEAGLVVLPIDEQGLSIKPLFKDEVVYASTTRAEGAGPVTIEEMASAPSLILYDAHSGWKDPTRRQILERAQLAGVKIDPVIEVEHVETAILMVAAGSGETMLSKSIATSTGFPPEIRIFPFAEPLYDTIALVQRESTVLSPATQKIAELAERTLLEKGYSLR